MVSEDAQMLVQKGAIQAVWGTQECLWSFSCRMVFILTISYLSLIGKQKFKYILRFGL
jgi:hypothetical protein